MLAKRFRLNENQVKKVLQKKKPFFSYTITANVVKNNIGHARIGIILNRAQTKGSVNRNMLRRFLYSISQKYIENIGADIVYTFKGKKYLSGRDESFRKELEKDTLFVLQKIQKDTIGGL